MNFFSSDENESSSAMKVSFSSHPFKVGADRVQLIAKKVLNTLLPFPKKSKDPTEAPESIISVSEPFTTPTEKLNQLIAVNNLFCNLLESPDVFAASVNRLGLILDISGSIEQVLGYKPGELIGINGSMFIHPDDLGNLRYIDWDGKKGKGIQLRCKSRDDRWKWIRFIILQKEHEGSGSFFLLGATIEHHTAEENSKKEKALQEAASGIEASLNKWRGLMGLAQSPQNVMDNKTLITGLEEIAAILETLLDDLKRQREVG